MPSWVKLYVWVSRKSGTCCVGPRGSFLHGPQEAVLLMAGSKTGSLPKAGTLAGWLTAERGREGLRSPLPTQTWGEAGAIVSSGREGHPKSSIPEVAKGCPRRVVSACPRSLCSSCLGHWQPAVRTEGAKNWAVRQDGQKTELKAEVAVWARGRLCWVVGTK